MTGADGAEAEAEAEALSFFMGIGSRCAAALGARSFLEKGTWSVSRLATGNFTSTPVFSVLLARCAPAPGPGPAARTSLPIVHFSLQLDQNAARRGVVGLSQHRLLLLSPELPRDPNTRISYCTLHRQLALLHLTAQQLKKLIAV
jgi:hypothetical protein